MPKWPFLNPMSLCTAQGDIVIRGLSQGHPQETVARAMKTGQKNSWERRHITWYISDIDDTNQPPLGHNYKENLLWGEKSGTGRISDGRSEGGDVEKSSLALERSQRIQQLDTFGSWCFSKFCGPSVSLRWKEARLPCTHRSATKARQGSGVILVGFHLGGGNISVNKLLAHRTRKIRKPISNIK